MSIKLPNVFIENKSAYLLLNKLSSMPNNKFFSEKFLNNQIFSEFEDEEEIKEIVNIMIDNQFLIRKIFFDCEEGFSGTAISSDETCECGKTVKEHEFKVQFSFKKHEIVSAYNKELIELYFDNGGINVLKELRDNYSNIIPFVGAGISKSIGFPLWIELFKQAREYIPKENWPSFEMYYSKGNIDKLIAFIYDSSELIKNDEQLKMKLIRPQMKISPEIKSKLGESIHSEILKFDCDYIITTNYDELFEKTNIEINGQYEISKNIQTFEGFDELRNKKFIFHLHGDCNLMSSMVVSKKDYKRLYNEKENQYRMMGLIGKKSLLFMGFSMNDKYFYEEFNSICNSNKGFLTNYMITINMKKSEQERIMGNENLAFINIKATEDNEGNYNTLKQFNFIFEFIKGNIFIN